MESVHGLENHSIASRYKITKVLGKGAFGEVYLSFDTQKSEYVAIKVEPQEVKKPVLKLEISILRCRYICDFVDAGKTILNQKQFTYLVMSLAGNNLSELRKKQPDGKFSIHTTAMLGKQMVKAIQSIHRFGILHRDIKPGNFCIGREIQPGTCRPTCYLIDFGLSRKYVDVDGGHRDARTTVGFRGTARYASISAHTGKDLGRVDDLWSLFYMTIEFLTGTLPWKGKEKEKIGELKKKFTTGKLVNGLPQEMTTFFNHVKTLKFQTEPDYELIETLYDSMFKAQKVPVDIPYDWDKQLVQVDMEVDKVYAEAAEPSKTLVDMQPRPPADPIPSRMSRIRRKFRLAR